MMAWDAMCPSSRGETCVSARSSCRAADRLTFDLCTVSCSDLQQQMNLFPVLEDLPLLLVWLLLCVCVHHLVLVVERAEL